MTDDRESVTSSRSPLVVTAQVQFASDTGKQPPSKSRVVPQTADGEFTGATSCVAGVMLPTSMISCQLCARHSTPACVRVVAQLQAHVDGDDGY